MFHPHGPTFLELARQALSSTERGYDLLAPKFDYTPFRTPQPVLDAVADHLGPGAPFGAGLDLCCGTGAGVALLRPLCRERVVGIDFSRGMLEVCRRRTAGAAALQLVRGDVLALPFGPAFDVATCFGALGHVLPRDQRRFVGEVARVLRPGGRFAFVTSEWPPVWSKGYWLSRLFNGAMRVRNWLLPPPFVMYYLTFLLPEAAVLCRECGLEVEVRDLGLAGELSPFRLVLARRPAG
jgi:SAM-dependent methyltransferase